MTRVLTPARGAILAVMCASLALPVFAQGQLKRAINVGESATRKAATTQVRINQLDDERTDLVTEYRSLLQRKTAADLYARQQTAAVESQVREIAVLEDQLGRIDEIKSQTGPMLEQLIDDLEAFVDADLPFKLTERKERIERLRGYLTNPNLDVTERYRQIMDAYVSEMEVGRTSDTWAEDIEVDGKTVTVQMVLFGRVALVYMDPTKTYAARYDRPTGEWMPLENKYKAEIAKAIRILEGKRTQDVMYVPATKLGVTSN